MSENSSIEWTDATWNPLAGCTAVGPGCQMCYAASLAHRLDAMGQTKYAGTTRKAPSGKVIWTGKIVLDEAALVKPLKRRKSTIYFVNSMSDLFHEGVPDSYILDVVRVMRMANWHTFQVLTKRADRLRDLLQSELKDAAEVGHIWWGVSVENRMHGLPRIEHLRAAPAKVRFLSIEPLLEDLGTINLDGIHWAIVGGESGPGARPMERDWVVSIRDQCAAAGVAFFFKQWGGRNKKKAGRALDGVTYDALPVVPAPAITHTPGDWQPLIDDLTRRHHQAVAASR